MFKFHCVIAVCLAGPSLHNFSTATLRWSSFYHVELRAFNHLTFASLQQRIDVGQPPQRVTVMTSPASAFLVNESDNFLTALVNGIPLKDFSTARRILFFFVLSNNYGHRKKFS